MDTQLYIKDGTIRDRSRIIIIKDNFQIINPTEEMVLADGWQQYTPPQPVEPQPTITDQLRDMVLEQYNGRTDITDEEALKRPLLVYSWDTYMGKSLAAGQVVSHDGKLWRVRQDVAAVLDNQPPSLATAALYEVIEVEPAGSSTRRLWRYSTASTTRRAASSTSAPGTAGRRSRTTWPRSWGCMSR